MQKKQVAVLGATGYTGSELLRLMLNHPLAEVVFAGSSSSAGRLLAEVLPQFTGVSELVLQDYGAEDLPAEVELVFCALPHGLSVDVVPSLRKQGLRVIDLSADFRLREAELYPRWYEREHPAPELLGEAVYGLTELRRTELATAGLVANPGCYPTAVLLALAPLLKEGLVQTDSIIIDAKSGVTGAGRAPKQPFHFPECNDSFKAYRVASHQHTPEIEQELSALAGLDGEGTGEGLTVTFTPHLIPQSRGILSTIYIKLLRDHDLDELYRSFYRDEPFVSFLAPPLLPETRWVKGTNCCHLAVRQDERTGRVIILAAIDNLVKGAAGQAIQNMNVMFGWPDDTGLRLVGLVP